MHFVFKWLKMNILQKQNFSYLQNDKNGQRDGQKTHLCNSVKYAFIWLRNSLYLRLKYRVIYLYIHTTKRAQIGLFLSRLFFASQALVCISEIVHYGGHPSRAYVCRGYSFPKFFLDFFYPIILIKFGYYQNKYYLCGVI